MTVSASAPAQPAPPPESLEELFRANVFDAYFDFNQADIRPDAREALSKTAEFLRTHPEVHVSIEGHCDDRGSTEYNLGLGDRRATAAKNFLVSLGVPAASSGNHQLRQGASVLHPGNGRMLATESARPFRHGSLMSADL